MSGDSDYRTTLDGRCFDVKSRGHGQPGCLTKSTRRTWSMLPSSRPDFLSWAKRSRRGDTKSYKGELEEKIEDERRTSFNLAVCQGRTASLPQV